MADFHFLPLWVGDYRRDTQHLSCLEHGAYFQLLMTMWVQGGSLPNDPKLLARITGLRVDHWRRIAPMVMPFFTMHTSGLTFHHRRLDSERERILARRAVAARGGHAKALKTNKSASTPAGIQHTNGSGSAGHTARVKQAPSTAQTLLGGCYPEPELESIPVESQRLPPLSSSVAAKAAGVQQTVEEFKKDPLWVDVCTQIVQAYEFANIPRVPDTGLVWVWRELGFKRGLVLAVAKAEIAKFNGKFKPLTYLQPIIERAHALGKDVAAADKPIAWDMPLKHFKETGQWMLRDTPAPGQAGCKVPSDKLREFGLVARETVPLN